MGCVGSKQKLQGEGDEAAPSDAPNRNSKLLIEDDKASVGVNEDLPFIDENGGETPDAEKKLAVDEEKAETKTDDELPARESIVLKEETADSENVQVIKEEGEGVEHERVIVTKQVKVIREEMQFIKPGDAEPSSEEKKSCETETIKERHVIIKRVLQIDGEDVPGTETTKEEVTREVIVNEEKEETVDQEAEKRESTCEKAEAKVAETVPEPVEEHNEVNHDNIEVKMIENEEGSSPEPLSEQQVAQHMKAQQEAEVVVNGHHDEDVINENGVHEETNGELDEIAATKAAQRSSLIEQQEPEVAVEN